jgi:CRP-like cAMP-binding protein
MEIDNFNQIEGIDLIQKLPIFSLLTFDETSKLGAIAIPEQLDQGTVIIECNALGEALYIICEGEVSVTRGGENDDSEELGRLGVGKIFGEMSLIDDLLTSARVTAVEACKLLKLPRAEFQKLLDSDDKLALKIYRSFCRALTERLRHSNDLLTASQALEVGVV